MHPLHQHKLHQCAHTNCKNMHAQTARMCTHSARTGLAWCASRTHSLIVQDDANRQCATTDTRENNQTQTCTTNATQTNYNSFQLTSCILTTRFLTGGQTSDNLSVLHSQCSNTIHCCGTRSKINQSTSTHAYLQEMHETCHSKTACHKTDMKHAITKLLTHTCGLSSAHVQPLLKAHDEHKQKRQARTRT